MLGLLTTTLQWFSTLIFLTHCILDEQKTPLSFRRVGAEQTIDVVKNKKLLSWGNILVSLRS
jgi:hypothetical protein